jgi:hypothetical protein
MQHIDSRAVEFTTTGEMIAKDRFEELLDEGHSISSAAATALEEGINAGQKFARNFVDYLSENTLWITNKGRGVVIPTNKGAEVEGLTAHGRQAVIRTVRARRRTYAEALSWVRGGPAIVRQVNLR